MSDPTSRHTHDDDDALRQLGVRHVVERGADGTVTPRALGGEPAPPPDAAALSQSIPECSDCATRREAIARDCNTLGYPPGRPIIFQNPGGGHCYCLCP